MGAILFKKDGQVYQVDDFSLVTLESIDLAIAEATEEIATGNRIIADLQDQRSRFVSMTTPTPADAPTNPAPAPDVPSDPAPVAPGASAAAYPKVIDGIRYFQDGDQICAVDDATFVDLQTSLAGFGPTEADALAALNSVRAATSGAATEPANPNVVPLQTIIPD